MSRDGRLVSAARVGRSYEAVKRCARAAGRMLIGVSLLCAVGGVSAAPAHAKILFHRDTPVPRLVREFAWRIIEVRCNYQRFELEQRSFWAYDTRATRVNGEVAYSIDILSERTWKKTEPAGMIQMVVVDDGALRLGALRSVFVACTPDGADTTIPYSG